MVAKQAMGRTFPETITYHRQVGKIYAPVSEARWKATFYEGGQRRSRTANTYEECKKKLEKELARLHEAQPLTKTLTKIQTDEYCCCSQIVAQRDRRLGNVIREWDEAYQLLPEGVSLHEAVRGFAEQYGTLKPISVKEAIEQYQDQRTCGLAHKKSEWSRLKSFQRTFGGQIRDLNREGLRLWLNGLKVAAPSRNNFARTIRTFFRYCEKHDYLPRNHRLNEALETVNTNPSDPSLLTPEEFERIFEHLDDRIKPIIALVSHGGLRTAEARRISQSKIDKEHIIVDKSIAKTQSRRVIKIQPRLRQIPEQYPIIGPGQKLNSSWFDKLVSQAFKSAGVKKEDNIFRDSFCSYRYAQANAAEASKDAGNSEAILKSNYKAMAKKKDADRWFGVE